MACAVVRKLAHAEHFGLERTPDGVQQVGQGGVVGEFGRGAAGGPDAPKGGKIGLNGCCVLGCAHAVSLYYTTEMTTMPRNGVGRVATPPRAAIRPYPPTPPTPYPTPMPTRTRPPAIVLPAEAGTSTPRASNSRCSPTPQGVGAGLALLPGGCFAHPLPSAFSLSGGCFQVVSSGIRLVAAPRGSNPPSRFNPQAAPLCGPHIRDSNPSCAHPRRHSTSI